MTTPGTSSGAPSGGNKDTSKRRSLLPAPKTFATKLPAPSASAKSREPSPDPDKVIPEITTKTTPPQGIADDIFQIGSRVTISGVKLGVLRYFGNTHFADGEWCGIELDEADGKHDGIVDGIRYFNSAPNSGIFAPKSKVDVVSASKSRTPSPDKLKRQRESGDTRERSASPEVQSNSLKKKAKSKLASPKKIKKDTSSNDVKTEGVFVASTPVVSSDLNTTFVVDESKNNTEPNLNETFEVEGDGVLKSFNPQKALTLTYGFDTDTDDSGENSNSQNTPNNLNLTFEIEKKNETPGKLNSPVPDLLSPASQYLRHQAEAGICMPESDDHDYENVVPLRNKHRDNLMEISHASSLGLLTEIELYNDDLLSEGLGSSFRSADQGVSDKKKFWIGESQSIEEIEVDEIEVDREISGLSTPELDVSSGSEKNSRSSPVDPVNKLNEPDLTFNIGKCQGPTPLSESDKGNANDIVNKSDSKVVFKLTDKTYTIPEACSAPEFDECDGVSENNNPPVKKSRTKLLLEGDKTKASLELACTAVTQYAKLVLGAEQERAKSLSKIDKRSSWHVDSERSSLDNFRPAPRLSRSLSHVEYVQVKNFDPRVMFTDKRQKSFDIVPSNANPTNASIPSTEDIANTQLTADLKAGHHKQERPISVVSACSADTGFITDTEVNTGSGTGIKPDRPVSVISTTSTDTGILTDYEVAGPRRLSSQVEGGTVSALDRRITEVDDEDELIWDDMTEEGEHMRKERPMSIVSGSSVEAGYQPDIESEGDTTLQHTSSEEDPILPEIKDLNPEDASELINDGTFPPQDTDSDVDESNMDNSWIERKEDRENENREDNGNNNQLVETKKNMENQSTDNSPSSNAGQVSISSEDTVMEIDPDHQNITISAPYNGNLVEVANLPPPAEEESVVMESEEDDEMEVHDVVPPAGSAGTSSQDSLCEEVPGTGDTTEVDQSLDSIDETQAYKDVEFENTVVQVEIVPNSSQLKVSVSQDFEGEGEPDELTLVPPIDMAEDISVSDSLGDTPRSGVESTECTPRSGVESEMADCNITPRSEVDSEVCHDDTAKLDSLDVSVEADEVDTNESNLGVSKPKTMKRERTPSKDSNGGPKPPKFTKSPKTTPRKSTSKLTSPAKVTEDKSTDSKPKPRKSLAGVQSRLLGYTKKQTSKEKTDEATKEKKVEPKKTFGLRKPSIVSKIDSKRDASPNSSTEISSKESSKHESSPSTPKQDLKRQSFSQKSSDSKSRDSVDGPKKTAKRTIAKSKYGNITSSIDTGKSTTPKPKPVGVAVPKSKIISSKTGASSQNSSSNKDSKTDTSVSKTAKSNSSVPSMIGTRKSSTSSLPTNKLKATMTSGGLSNGSTGVSSSNGSTPNESTRRMSGIKPPNKTTAALKAHERKSSFDTDSLISVGSTTSQVSVSSQGSRTVTSPRETRKTKAGELSPQRVTSAKRRSLVEPAISSKLDKEESRRSSVAVAPSRLGQSKSSIPSRAGSPKTSVSNSSRTKSGKGAVSHLKRPHQPDLVTNSIANTTTSEEITRLEALCESRTKQLNHAKIQLKHNAMGFEALSVLVDYMATELGAFQSPELTDKLQTTEEALVKAKDYLEELTRQRNALIEEIKCLKDKHQKDIEILNEERDTQLHELDDRLHTEWKEQLERQKAKHNQDIINLKDNQQTSLDELVESQQRVLKSKDREHEEHVQQTKNEYEQQMSDMHRRHDSQLEEITMRFNSIKMTLGEKVEFLRNECEEMRHREQTYMEACQRDTDLKVKLALAPYKHLPEEIESLKAVLDMKNQEIHSLRAAKVEVEKKLEELPITQDKLKAALQKVENLEAIINMKQEYERQLSEKHNVLLRRYDRESKVNKRLSMDNEELSWRLSIGETGSPDSIRRSISHSPNQGDLYPSPDPNSGVVMRRSPHSMTQSPRSPRCSQTDFDNTPCRSPRSSGGDWTRSSPRSPRTPSRSSVEHSPSTPGKDRRRYDPMSTSSPM